MKTKFFAVTLTAILILSILVFRSFPPVATAATPNPIILPFWTGWDGTNPVGRTNVVECAKDFYGYYGPDNPLPPELGVRTNEVPIPSPGTFFGYNFLTHYLMAAGYFGSSDSYCYFSLFDATADSDYQTPIKLKPHTYLNIWYYHHQLGNCMVDAEIFNAYDRTFFRLGDFSYNDKYVVDQNGVRIHPAYRNNDPTGTWNFASFDLSIVYDAAPGYMYVTKILVGFDNRVDHATGQARTYFDLLHISYGVGWSYTSRNPYNGAKDTCSVSIIAWESGLDITGYTLTLKVTVSGYTHWYEPDYTPMYLNVEVRDIPNLPHHPANVEASPEPIGINLEQKNYSQNVWEFAMDCASAIIGYLPFGSWYTAYELACGFYTLTTETGGATYQWPRALIFGQTHPQWIMGEAYIRVHELSEGRNVIDVVCWTDYYYWLIDRWLYFWPQYVEIYFEWTNAPDPLSTCLSISCSSGGTTDPAPGTYWYMYGSSVTVAASAYSHYYFSYWLLDGATVYNNPITFLMDSDHTLEAYFTFYNNAPNTPSTPSGPTLGYRNVWYTYSATAIDPDGDDIRYEFEFSGPIPTVSFRTGWYASNQTGSLTVKWDTTDPPGTYYVRVRAQDRWTVGSWSPYLTVNIVNRAPNTPSTPSGPTSGHVYTNYNYSTSTVDPDGDFLLYRFYWGDGTVTPISNPSNKTTTASHSWNRPGTYQVEVQAEDSWGAKSNWSSTLAVNITQNDAGTGGDAGDNFTAATPIITGLHRGTLYLSSPNDTQDWYQFYVESGQRIDVVMTPPSGVDFDLRLYDPSGTLKNASYLGPGLTDSVSYTANSSGYWRAKIYIYYGEGQYSFWLLFSWPDSGGCPILHVYNGTEYICEGLLDIHNPEGIDVVRNHTVVTIPQRINGAYLFQLVEHPQTHSHIDQVKLYAILADKSIIELPLIWAWHSEYGNVLPQLWFSDEWKTETKGANQNNGTSQSIQLKFSALPPNIKPIAFIFQIEGNNQDIKE